MKNITLYELNKLFSENKGHKNPMACMLKICVHMFHACVCIHGHACAC